MPQRSVDDELSSQLAAQLKVSVAMPAHVSQHVIDSAGHAAWPLFDAAAAAAVEHGRRVAVDGEWDDAVLGLIEIGFADGAVGGDPSAAKITVFIVDALALRKDARAVAQHLAPVLRAAGARKLLWDCREDSWRIREYLGAAIAPVFDLQLYERLTRQDAPRKLYMICGMKRALEEFPALAVFKAAKDSQNLLPRGASSVFLARPLPPDVLAYAATDVAALFHLDYELRRRTNAAPVPGDADAMVLAASLVYRDQHVTVVPKYRRNPFLPFDILPTLSPRPGSHRCVGCQREVSEQGPGRYCLMCHKVNNPPPPRNSS
jgi:hypothetical protein